MKQFSKKEQSTMHKNFKLRYFKAQMDGRPDSEFFFSKLSLEKKKQ